MILVDAGVIIDYLRTKEPKLDHLFRSRPVAICGVTRSEVLAGARTSQDRKRIIRVLRPFHRLTTREALWDIVGDTLAALYARGITVPFPDTVVATLGIEFDFEVGARDPHFPAMQRVLPRLKLFQEPR